MSITKVGVGEQVGGAARIKGLPPSVVSVHNLATTVTTAPGYAISEPIPVLAGDVLVIIGFGATRPNPVLSADVDGDPATLIYDETLSSFTAVGVAWWRADAAGTVVATMEFTNGGGGTNMQVLLCRGLARSGSPILIDPDDYAKIGTSGSTQTLPGVTLVTPGIALFFATIDDDNTLAWSGDGWVSAFSYKWGTSRTLAAAYKVMVEPGGTGDVSWTMSASDSGAARRMALKA